MPQTEALDWFKKKPDSFSPVERQFVSASKTRTINARVLAVMISVLVLLLIGGPIAWLGMAGVTVPYAWSVVRVRLHIVDPIEPDMVRFLVGLFGWVMYIVWVIRINSRFGP